jgi:F-type H+-transporting ATPase subunit gamma
MKVICLATLLASAAAFTSQSAAFTTQSPLVGERVNDVVTSGGGAHRTRRATIVMDGKSNGEFYMILVLATYALD